MFLYCNLYYKNNLLFFKPLIYKGLSFAEQEEQGSASFPLAFSFSVSLQMKNAPSTTIVGFDPERLDFGSRKKKTVGIYKQSGKG